MIKLHHGEKTIYKIELTEAIKLDRVNPTDQQNVDKRDWGFI